MMTPRRPNILFLLVDCLRADYLDGRAHRVQAPNLLRLARGGLHATQMIAAATTTTPCVASIFTGTYSMHHGIRSLRGYKLRSGLLTLPEELQRIGYHTHAETTGPLLPQVGLDRGFSSYEFRHQDAYLGTEWGQRLLHRLTKELPEPWFAFVHLWELHENRRVGPGFDSRRFGRNRYERALSSLDADLTTLLGELSTRAVVVVHGDHGEQLRANRRLIRFYRWQRKVFGRQYPPWPSFPAREGHGFDVWEPLIRVPFVVHYPGHIPARRLSSLTRQVDIMPTLLEVVGEKPPARIDGRSVLSLLDDELNEPDREAFVEACGASIADARDHRCAIRTSRWKYIESAGGQRTGELYDLKRDPRERHNVIDRESGVAAALRSTLAEYQAVARGAEDSVLTPEEKSKVDAQLRALGYIE